MHIYDIIYGLHIFTDFKEPALNRVFQRFYQNFSGMGVTTNYWTKVKKNAWNILKTTLQEGDDFIKSIITTYEDLNLLLTDLNTILRTKLKAT
jgi:hypothetical protein